MDSWCKHQQALQTDSSQEQNRNVRIPIEATTEAAGHFQNN